MRTLLYYTQSEGVRVRYANALYYRLKGIIPSAEKQHINWWLSELGLSDVKNRFSKDLSGGMKRRLSIGMALIGN